MGLTSEQPVFHLIIPAQLSLTVWEVKMHSALSSVDGHDNTSFHSTLQIFGISSATTFLQVQRFSFPLGIIPGHGLAPQRQVSEGLGASPDSLLEQARSR
jgi:hypothetical protein